MTKNKMIREVYRIAYEALFEEGHSESSFGIALEEILKYLGQYLDD